MAIFTFVVDFRGGTYCSQVEAVDMMLSLSAWIEKIAKEQNEIKHLGPKVIQELKNENDNPDHKPVKLIGLENAWCTVYSTRKGLFNINIIQTDNS